MRRRMLLGLISSLVVASFAAADCGKIIIVMCPGGQLPPWVMNNPNIIKPPPPDPNVTPMPGNPDDLVPPVDPNSNPPTPVEPNPNGPPDIGEAGDSLGLFEEPKQLGFIAWNGAEQVLAIRTDEKAAGKGAYMSILPLPGKPISVKAGSNAMWNKAENVFYEAFRTAGITSDNPEKLGVVLDTKIGAHHIFVWKVDSFENFTDKIQNYVNTRYKGKAVPIIPKELKQIMERYVREKKYEYFAFDVVAETGKLVSKQTILYHFETPKGELYYPLVISQSGGVGKTAIELLIVSNKETLTYPDGSARAVITDKFKNHFEKFAKARMTRAQMTRIDAGLAKLFAAPDPLYARWYTTKGDTDIRSFKDDFRLVAK